VIDVRSNGKTAQVQDLVTGVIEETHIQNARFVREPQGESQLDEWLRVYLDEGYDNNTSMELIRVLGEEMYRPLKRSRTAYNLHLPA
jgi:hypothetical protein